MTTVIKGNCHCIKYARIPLLCPYTGEYGSVKTSILAYFIWCVSSRNIIDVFLKCTVLHRISHRLHTNNLVSLTASFWIEYLPVKHLPSRSRGLSKITHAWHNKSCFNLYSLKQYNSAESWRISNQIIMFQTLSRGSLQPN